MNYNYEDNFINIYEEISNKEEKQVIARKIADKVKNGQIIGFGSGSTSYLAICEIAKKVEQEKINITAIPTSYETKMLCAYFNIPTTTLINAKPEWCFDGADEVDENNWLIKGKGAAMFKEKLNIKNSKEVYILVDETKFVNKLGIKSPVPVECYPEAVTYVQEEIKKIGASCIKLRQAKMKGGPVITENGNVILDCTFENINEDLENKLKTIVGVIETGLFINYNNIIIVK